MVRHFSEYRRYFIGCTASGKPDIVDKNFVLRQSRTIYPYTENYIERSIKRQSVLRQIVAHVFGIAYRKEHSVNAYYSSLRQM